MKAMVLAAGVGSRLDPLTADVPKPLVPVANFPVMQHLLQLLQRHGINSVVANLHYLPEKLIEYFGDGSRLGADLQFRMENKLSGDAGGVRFCRDFLEDGTFVVLMGDLLTDIDISYVVAQHKAKGALASIALKQVDDVSHFGVAVLDEDGFIKGFQEKPAKEEALSNLASTGIYVLEPEVFDHIPREGDYGFGRQLFPKLVRENLPVLGVEVGSYWSDVGTIEQYWNSNLQVLSKKIAVDLPGYNLSVQNGYNMFVADGAVLDSNVLVQGNVMVGRGARIAPGVRLIGNVVIGDGAVVEAGCELRDTVLWSDVKVERDTKLNASVVASCGVVNAIDPPKSARGAAGAAVKTQAPLQVGACV
ncbi:MAG: NDP-sugar synthase [Cyanobacteria bacterium SZAS TMP-1]|nr:NDP-sugar synthase [Cyanobacteria bacterium SZAS TMP-1]